MSESNMKRWSKEAGVPATEIAALLGLSRASVTQKLNRKTEGQRRDCLILRDAWGLSADFVQDLVPYEAKFAESVRDHDRDHEEVSV